MFNPSIDEVKQYTNTDYHYIPLKKDIYSDLFTPLLILKKLRTVSDQCFILESHEDSTKWGRYSFIGFNPKHEITCNNGRMIIDSKDVGKKNPTNYVKKIIKENKSVKLDDFPTFTGGLVGFFAYEYLKYSEPTINFVENDENHFKDMDLMFFDEIICFDHYKQKISIIVNVELDDYENDYVKKCQRIEEIERIIKMDHLVIDEPLKLRSDFKPSFTKEEYCHNVEICKKHIKEGDIFQIVLANRLEAECTGSLIDTYRILRTTNPSPYMFYFHSQSIEVAGASPETMVKLEDGILHSFPIAGSRKRGKDDKEDQELIDSLLKDEKELAEHNMLVDLGRNDLGKISKFNTVKLESYKDVLKFSKVIHLSSHVTSEILDDKEAMDAVETMLPAGTLSGAPKIEACNIIAELEGNKRGIYGGGIGYLDFNGNMDLCIGIRLAYKKARKVYVCSGAGIVYDSVPESEYQECINKASAVVEAVKMSNGGIDG